MNAGYIAGCYEKKSFASWTAAATAAKRFNRRSERDGLLHVYHCLSCGFFHCGSLDKNEQRVNRKERKKFLEEGTW